MAEIRVPVMARFCVADPDPSAPKVEYERLSEVLTQPRHTDRFFCQYSNAEHPYRLSTRGGTAPRMVLAVFDIDDKVAKKERTPARSEWRVRERAKISRLVRETNAFVYETNGGYRIVGVLPEPWVLHDLGNDAATWTAKYKSWCRYLERVYDIVPDRDENGTYACADWPHIFRIPHATRERGGRPENLPVYGPAHDPGIWTPDLAPEDVVVPETTHRADVPDRGHLPMSSLGVAVAHAITAAESLPPAISKQGGHNALLVAASTVYRGFNLPREMALEILEGVYNPRCEPPWKTKEINHKLDAVERSGERWGEEIDAIMLADAAERATPRRREPTDLSDDEDEPVPGAQKTEVSVSSGQRTEPAGWVGNAGGCADYFRSVGEPLATGIETIDRMTSGGFRRGEPVVIGGAPDTGKTTVALTIALKWARELGLKVAVAAFDEPAPRVKARVGQALGFDRKALYRGELADDERAAMNAVPIRVYDGYEEKVSIEAVAQRLAEFGPGVLVIDSLQTARSIRVNERMPDLQAYTQIALSIRDMAQKYQHLVLVTSELTKEFYRNHEQALDLDPVAAFAGSRAIAHMAVFGIVLLQPPKPAEHILARVAKNKTLGTGRADFAIKFDHERSSAYEVPLPEPDREEFGDTEPKVDAVQVIRSLVKSRKCANLRSVVANAKVAGLPLTENQIREALFVLEGNSELVDGADGFLSIQPAPLGR